MAVGAARVIATRRRKIKRLKSLYREEVEEFRADAIKATADNLWRRYKQECRRAALRKEPILSYLDWLVSMEHMEQTFRHDSRGMSLSVRRKWSVGYFNFLTHEELTLADDPSNVWVIDALQRAINDRIIDPDWYVVVETAIRKAIKPWLKEEGVSFMFVKVLRPTQERDLD
jgi:hypothetical protein